MLATFFLAILEGVALIVSPCILPILPIILSGSLTGSRQRPLGIITGFVVSFVAATFLTRLLVSVLPIDANLLRNSSLIILFILGVIMISSSLTEKFSELTSSLSNIGQSLTRINKDGFVSGFLFGCLVGIIWIPCAGPILAVALVQVAIQQTTLQSVVIMFGFAMGASIPMLLIALLGRKILNQFHFLREHTGMLRKLLGCVIIISVGLIAYNPEIFAGTTYLKDPDITVPNELQHGVKPYKAPNISGIDTWINSPALTMSGLKGKVVLIDFWTYSCINCVRTIPYLKDWYAKYRDKGFVIIGVHSPEFPFEQNPENVRRAVTQYGITYPVALDNRFITWQNYHNKFWPAHYLINKDGYVVYEHFGEGAYATTENNIQFLLGMTPNVRQELVPSETIVNRKEQTPETYLGYSRANNFASVEDMSKGQPLLYTQPKQLQLNQWGLGGTWQADADKIIAVSKDATLKIHFQASEVYAVMGAPGKSVRVQITVHANDGTITQKQLEVSQNKLYSLVAFRDVTNGILEITVDTPGLELYTFTFG